MCTSQQATTKNFIDIASASPTELEAVAMNLGTDSRVVAEELITIWEYTCSAAATTSAEDEALSQGTSTSTDNGLEGDTLEEATGDSAGSEEEFQSLELE